MALLVEATRQHRLTLVHISSDYVFDGSQMPHAETEPFSPLGVYGRPRPPLMRWSDHCLRTTC
jgi:dTDP-4-dehydrorhamnose 3,5-epimerase